MQGWLFLFEKEFWRQPQVQALVTSIPLGKMLILDLFSETNPIYSLYNGYYGQPFIWCMLHNFGGTHGMYGSLNRINENFFTDRKRYRNLIGIGLTMEGIEQNDVVYDYFTETVWYQTEAPDMSLWFDRYVQRRYGFDTDRTELLQKPWQLLRRSVFHDPIGIHNHGVYVITSVPGPGLHSQLSYEPKYVYKSMKLFAKFLNRYPSSIESETFVYDLVDISRQTLQLIFDHHYEQLELALIQQYYHRAKKSMSKMLWILDLIESILQASDHWLLFNWIQDARVLGNGSEKEQNFYEWQARNQISSWGPNDNIVDYAAKQWSGMFRFFYKPRWQFYFDYLQQIVIEQHKSFRRKDFVEKLFNNIELPFTKATDQILIEKANSKFSNLLNRFKSFSLIIISILFRIATNLINDINLLIKELDTLQLLPYEDDNVNNTNLLLSYKFYKIQSRFPFIEYHHDGIQITGTTGVAAANGFHYYLKYYANCSISWSGDHCELDENQKPPKIGDVITKIIKEKFRYYLNACTASYSMVWWQWPRWQREIDWMALNGINLPLAFNGQEEIYRRTFLHFNLTMQEIDDYFTGPAYLAWNRMGNIQSWSGPLSENWHRNQHQLQLKILDRMRNFGMYPVLPGFSGHVPRSFRQKFPEAKINKLANWNHFGSNYSETDFLEPEDPLFVQIGNKFIEEYIDLFDTDHFYSIDLFVEETPSSKYYET
ncbi:alpha-N-acetylglucosaminidase-like protein 1 [Sarcoptes scabiei]|uniref:Alpha-N-acetylglucosaminidase-like protein 1 n=1 Tax=Sarcoptes scabiei TaxID=52283 RepID=A0A131ZVH6_SARSC|nr:alpha-N-acetylglucosaminidase-like protein 1 [Sarcoptes scabiei]